MSTTEIRQLRFAQLPPLPLECGEVLPHATMAYHLDGTLSPRRDNVVLVLHALTGSADALGDWWKGVVGPGLAIDTDRFAVLAPKLLGSCYGSSGPGTHGDSEQSRLATCHTQTALRRRLSGSGAPSQGHGRIAATSA